MSLVPSLSIYVDEQGDRGFSSKSSDYFCVTAVIVPDESNNHMRAVIGGLRYVIGTTRPLHWVEHFRPRHEHRRSLAAELCAGIPGVVVVYALAHKATLMAGPAMKSDNTLFYHYVTKLALERAAFACNYWPGGARKARVFLASIKGTSAADTEDYYRRFSAGSSTQSPVYCLADNAKVASTGQYDGLQLADLHQGMFGAAIKGDDTDATCGAHLVRVGHQVRRDHAGRAVSWGLKLYPDSIQPALAAKAWWSEWAIK